MRDRGEQGLRHDRLGDGGGGEPESGGEPVDKLGDLVAEHRVALGIRGAGERIVAGDEGRPVASHEINEVPMDGCETGGDVLAASDGGKELDRTNGRYKNIIVAGFDGGEAQREAVAKGFLLGSVAQDPYQMGYQSVALALKAAQDQPVADIDTGSWWYDAENIDSEDISVLIYD